jgi:putative ABC transport system ATP-binding protein
MIRLCNLERSYNTPAGQTWVLRRINLEIREGEFITIRGPSGAGKSSLLNVLALLDDSWPGEYWFQAQAIHGMKRKQRSELGKRNIGMVFQSYHLLDDLTVCENIELPLSYKDVPNSQRQSLVADTLDQFQVVAKKDLYPSQLSGGRQQPVGIARAVIHRPALLCRRTYRQLALLAGKGNHGTLPHAKPARNHDRASHARGAECRLWLAHDSALRRLDGE